MLDLTSPAATAAQRRARARARLADAARLLPVLGLVLVAAPDLLLTGTAREGATVPWLTYLFAVWIGLVALAAWVARTRGRIEADAADGAGAP